jgi:hypothetical protein
MTSSRSRQAPELNENLLSDLSHLVNEVKGLRDSVEELYVLLDHVWRNRDELHEVLNGLRIAEPEEVKNIACIACHAIENISGAEALHRGWKEVGEEEEGYAGLCPACVEQGYYEPTVVSEVSSEHLGPPIHQPASDEGSGPRAQGSLF